MSKDFVLRPAKIGYHHMYRASAAGDESMPMIPFMARFPEAGARETRSVSVPPRQDLPEGEYSFVELYCDEQGCDCRRVIISVLRRETGMGKVWATISYGWESTDFYRQWGGVESDSDLFPLDGPHLDPLNPRTEYSTALLDLFRFLIQSPEYATRLQRHYEMFRKSVEEPVKGER